MSELDGKSVTNHAEISETSVNDKCQINVINNCRLMDGRHDSGPP